MIKIIASSTEWENYNISNNAARAPYFIVFENDKYVKSIKNPISWWGAWPKVAKLLKDEGCNLFIAWKIWENLKEMLNTYWIKYEETN